MVDSRKYEEVSSGWKFGIYLYLGAEQATLTRTTLGL